jgi:hypothetical protein
MSSLIYLSFSDDVHRGNIDCDTDTFYVMLAAASYTADQTAHLKRSDITGETVGTGYVSGGIPCTVTVTKDTGNKRISLAFSAVSWPAATFSARYAIYYKRRGGAASADELVALDDFGSTVSVTADTFNLTSSTYLCTVP